MNKPLPFRVRDNLTPIEKWRVDTFWDKEPETLAWIDSFKKGDYFLDVGANIGLYSLYAASRGVRVMALEPHHGNYMALVLNQRKHNRALNMVLMNVGAGNKSGMAEFCAQSVEAGYAGGGYMASGTNKATIFMWAIDDLTRTFGPYDHIKIDVDGEEDLVIEGMRDTLAFNAVRTCLVEVCARTKHKVLKAFIQSGYTTENQYNSNEPHSRIRRLRDKIDAENIIFTQKET